MSDDEGAPTDEGVEDDDVKDERDNPGRKEQQQDPKDGHDGGVETDPDQHGVGKQRERQDATASPDPLGAEADRRNAKAARPKKKKRRQAKDKASPRDTLSIDEAAGQEYLRRLPHQRRMALGAALAIMGLALTGSQASEVGALLVVGGLLLTMYSIHRFGRLGPERGSDSPPS